MTPTPDRGDGESLRGVGGGLGPAFVLSLALHLAAAAAGLLIPSGGGAKDSPAAPLLMVRLAAPPQARLAPADLLPVATPRPRLFPPPLPQAEPTPVATPAPAPETVSTEPSPSFPTASAATAEPVGRPPVAVFQEVASPAVAEPLPPETIASAAEPPTPPAVVAGHPPSDEARSSDLKGHGELLSLIRKRLAKALSYPESARRRGLSGDLVLGLLLSPEGRIAEISLLASSGNPFLDRAVLKTLRDDGPYPYLPGLIRVPVSFRLKTPS